MKNQTKIKVENQKTPRHKEKYAALNFKRQVKLRLEALDGIQEYVDQLNDKEKDWLNRFLEETVITNFQHKGKHHYKTQEKRREFYRDNNVRNRCIYTRSKAMGALTNIDTQAALANLMDFADYQSGVLDSEDSMIAMLDLKRKIESESKD